MIITHIRARVQIAFFQGEHKGQENLIIVCHPTLTVTIYARHASNKTQCNLNMC